MAFSPESSLQTSGFKPESFERLFEVESQNFWFRSRNRLIIWVLRKRFSNMASFLEIGCGTGFVLSGIEKAFPQTQLCGTEILAQGLCFASQRLGKNVELFQMDARKIPFENELDVIGAFDVLEHIEEDSLVLEQMHRALRLGGGIILSVPQHPTLWSYVDEYACHLRRYRAQELIAKAREVGFDKVKTISFVSVLFPLLWANRLRQRTSRGEYDPLQELRLGRFPNFALEQSLSIERFLIRMGFRFPFGGSLLLTAYKSR